MPAIIPILLSVHHNTFLTRNPLNCHAHVSRNVIIQRSPLTRLAGFFPTIPCSFDVVCWHHSVLASSCAAHHCNLSLCLRTVNTPCSSPERRSIQYRPNAKSLLHFKEDGRPRDGNRIYTNPRFRKNLHRFNLFSLVAPVSPNGRQCGDNSQ